MNLYVLSKEDVEIERQKFSKQHLKMNVLNTTFIAVFNIIILSSLSLFFGNLDDVSFFTQALIFSTVLFLDFIVGAFLLPLFNPDYYAKKEKKYYDLISDDSKSKLYNHACDFDFVKEYISEVNKKRDFYINLDYFNVKNMVLENEKKIIEQNNKEAKELEEKAKELENIEILKRESEQRKKEDSFLSSL